MKNDEKLPCANKRRTFTKRSRSALAALALGFFILVPATANAVSGAIGVMTQDLALFYGIQINGGGAEQFNTGPAGAFCGIVDFFGGDEILAASFSPGWVTFNAPYTAIWAMLCIPTTDTVALHRIYSVPFFGSKNPSLLDAEVDIESVDPILLDVLKKAAPEF